jgi:hypothetical protein
MTFPVKNPEGMARVRSRELRIPVKKKEIRRPAVESGSGKVEQLIRFHNEGKAFAEQRTVAPMARNRGTGGRGRRDKSTERLKNTG